MTNEEISSYFRSLGKRSARRFSEEERKRRASHAARARWGAPREEKPPEKKLPETSQTCTHIWKGLACSNVALPGKKYCYIHKK